MIVQEKEPLSAEKERVQIVSDLHPFSIPKNEGKPLPFFAEKGKGFVGVWMGGGLKALAFAAGLLVAVGCLDGMDAVGDVQAGAREVLRFDLLRKDACHPARPVLLVVKEEVLQAEVKGEVSYLLG